MNQTLARNKEYLAWIRSNPCCVSRQLGQNIVAHHITTSSSRGIGQKPSDYWAVPLSHDLHMELHNIGEKSFWIKRLGISHPHSIATTYLHRFISVQNDDGLELLRLLNEFASDRYRK